MASNFLNNVGSNSAKALIDGIVSVGKAAIHCIMPDDIEYYLCSLELVDYKDNRIGFLSFTVMPEQIVESYTPIQTMIKTQRANVTTFNDSFQPVDISIAGTFGRKFRLLLNYKDPYKSDALNTFGKSKIISLNFGEILGAEVGVKSGYGMTKILEHILRAANMTDYNGKPFYLKFCNYSLNTAYICDVVNFNLNQSMANNCMWNYSFTLRAVSDIRGYKKLKNKLKELLPQVAANSIASGVTNIASGMLRTF